MASLTGTRNFSVAEANVSGVVPVTLQANAQATLELLQAVRAVLGVPMLIHSLYRSPDHNADVGGVSTSQHMTADAADVGIPSLTLHEVADALHSADIAGTLPAFGQIIFYPVTTGHVHIGRGTKREWLIKSGDGAHDYAAFHSPADIPAASKGDLPAPLRALAKAAVSPSGAPSPALLFVGAALALAALTT
jgi:hypothetical protein